MFDFDRLLATLADQHVLCVGDLMLDEFVYGEVARISPEAPAPVLAVGRSETVVGGAGNVARNLACLGVRCTFVGLVGADEAGRSLAAALDAEPLIEAHLVIDASRPTTRKVRFVSEHFSTHLLRADWEQAREASQPMEAALLEGVLAAVPQVGAVVLSDYAKGTLTAGLVRRLIDGARQRGIAVIVDPKRADYAVYRGATVITPNRKELGEATRLPSDTDAEIVAAAEQLRQAVQSEAVLVTRSDKGMTLVGGGIAPVHVPAYPVKVRDVSGAGDTVVAALAAMLAARAEFEPAVRVANAAASVVVGKRGTATVSLPELRSRILPASSLAPEEKIVFDWSLLDERLGEWRRQGLRIGFTNGCFDLLHPGHVKVLTEARAACDRLVVGLNSDASARRLKGEGRPVQDQNARAGVLAALEAVDMVVIFDEDTPLALIERVRPRVLVKGGDYTRDRVVGREMVEGSGGEIILVDLAPGHSTTQLVERSRRPQMQR